MKVKELIGHFDSWHNKIEIYKNKSLICIEVIYVPHDNHQYRDELYDNILSSYGNKEIVSWNYHGDGVLSIYVKDGE